MKKKYGARVEAKEWLASLFESEEGTIDIIYGRIGQGKTYNSTADVLARLKRGSVEYVNWWIHYEGYDERDSAWLRFLGFLHLKRHFYFFPKENLHYFEISDEWAVKEGYKDFISWYDSRTDCVINADEGHVFLDSYAGTKVPMAQRRAILHGRHFNRTLVVITQRPTAVHVSARGNVNRFFKCEKIMSWPLLIFRKSEYQDMSASGETVDEEQKPLRTQWYVANNAVLEAYNSKYLRGGVPKSQDVAFEAYFLNYWERARQFGYGLVPEAARKVLNRLKAMSTAVIASRGTIMGDKAFVEANKRLLQRRVELGVAAKPPQT